MKRLLIGTWHLAVATTAVAMAAAAPPPFPKAQDRTLNIYWTDVPPKIDGRMDDPCWAQADVARDFALFKFAGWPTQKTEVRVLYDAENLYLFWTLYESNMDKLKVGPPEDMRDMLDFNADVAELFLDPGRTEQEYYQLCASPLGTRYDSSTRAGPHFNPSWTVVSGRFDAGWTLEQQIPFGQLAHAGQFMGTPQIGDHWGITFCRDEGPLHEWSQWVPTGGGFHEPKNNGHAYFRGRRQGAQPASVQVQPGELAYGPSAVTLKIAKASPKIEATLLVTREGRQVDRQTASADGTEATLTLPYRLLDGGRYRLRVTVACAGQTVLAGEAAAFLPDTRQLLEKMAREVTESGPVLERLGDVHPALKALRAELARFGDSTAAARRQIARAADLSASEWKHLVAQTDQLQTAWKKLGFDLALARLYPGKPGEPPVPFAVGAVGPFDKVYRDQPYAGSLETPIHLKLAGNEYGSFQLVVIPFWTDLKDVRVRFEPLKGPDGAMISVADCRWFRVAYVKLEAIDPQDPRLHPYEPDPLLGPEPFAVPAGEVRSLWVDVRAPEGLPAGRYVGRVTVVAGAHEASRPLVVEAYGFDLPKRSSLETDFWFSLYQWNRFYHGLQYTPELHARHAKMIGSYRVSSIPNDWITLCPQVPIVVEPDGHFTFDFGPLDQYIRQGLDNGSTAFWSALSCNSGWTAWITHPDRLVIERSTGRLVPLKRFVKEGTPYQEHPAYREFLTAYVKHLKELGIHKISYYELFDEPNDNSRWLAMIEHHQFFKSLVPELQLLCFGVDPLQEKAGRKALGLIDAWAPHLTYIGGGVHEEILKRRAAHGEKYWVYTCGGHEDKDGNISPYIYYHWPYIAGRIHSWMAWKYQVDGLLIFAMSGVPDGNVVADPARRWPQTDWLDGRYRGCGTLVYPGPNYDCVPGMRLASCREGLEDYEFFAVLKRLAAKLDTSRHAALAGRVRQALEVDPDIVRDVYVWTKDPGRLDRKRDELAALIREVQAAVK